MLQNLCRYYSFNGHIAGRRPDNSDEQAKEVKAQPHLWIEILPYAYWIVRISGDLLTLPVSPGPQEP